MKGRAEDQKSPSYYSWTALSKILKNVNGSTIDYNVFDSEYQTNELLKSLVSSYNSSGVTIKTRNKPESELTSEPDDVGDSNIDKMAKRASEKMISR